jgi:trehalose/maltose transport system permease protein
MKISSESGISKSGPAAAILVVAFCGLAVTPLFWHLLSSLKDSAEIAMIPPTLIPARPTLANYAELFRRRPFPTYLLNSMVIAALSSLICVGAASLAAYRLARAESRFRSIASTVLLALAFFPSIVFLLPLYELVRSVGLINQPWGLIVPYAALNLPLSVWLLTGYFERIPIEIEEAALMDGFTPLQTFFRIVLPLASPALVTATVLAFVFSWNEFMFALTFMNAEGSKTLTVAVASLSGAFVYQVPWGLIAAGVIASSAPLVVLVGLFQKRIVAGLTAGAVK